MKRQQDYGSELLPWVDSFSIYHLVLSFIDVSGATGLSVALFFFLLPMNVWDLVTGHLSDSIK